MPANANKKGGEKTDLSSLVLCLRAHVHPDRKKVGRPASGDVAGQVATFGYREIVRSLLFFLPPILFARVVKLKKNQRHKFSPYKYRRSQFLTNCQQSAKSPLVEPATVRTPNRNYRKSQEPPPV